LELDLAVPPERVAFLLLSEIYNGMGIETSGIPYAKDVPDWGRVFDEAAFLTAGR
jgi:hypothetical protein